VWLLGMLASSGRTVAAQDLQFRHLGVDDGLPSSWITGVVQDRRGFMWVATAHGVSRYDGHRFRTYRRERGNPYALPVDRVDQVYEDRGGALWVVTAAGLSRYDGAHDGFVTYPAHGLGAPTTTVRSVTAVLEDARGDFWVGTSAGLARFDRRTAVPTPFALPAAAGAVPAPTSYVMTLYEDRRSRLWVGTRGGLYVLDSAARTPRLYVHDAADPHSLPDSVVRAVTEDGAGGVWIGTDRGGVARWDARSWGAARGRFDRFRHDPRDPHSLAGDRAVRLAADRGRGGLWVGTENAGLDYLDVATGRFTHYRATPNAPSGIGGNSIWAIYEDAAGALWVGTYSGGLDVSTPNGAAIRRFGATAGDPTGPSHNAVPAFAEGRDGALWVATDGGGLNRFDPRTGRFAHFTTANTDLRTDAVVGVLEGRRGDVWVAVWGAGIARFDPARRRFTAYTAASANLPDDNVYELLEDRAGRLWIGTWNGVVAEFDRERRAVTRRYTVTPPGLERSAVVRLRELRDGTLAVGLAGGGVTLLDPVTGAQRHYVADAAGPDGLANNRVTALLEGDSAGGRAADADVLWVGTDGGLDRLDRRTGRVTHYGIADGLASEFVVGILPGGDGRLWLSTDRGVTRFDPRRRASRHFARADGLPRGEFLMRSSLRARDGTLYFGGNDGFVAIRPDRVVENRRPPRVALTGLQLFNRPIAVGAPGSPLGRPVHETSELTLAYDQNVVTFEFAALDFATPGKNQYAYRLDGFDTDWQDVGGQQTASYTNLAPGRYTFRVKASNADGVWNEDGTALRLVVTPPWWRTWWFRMAAACLAAVGAWRLLRFRERRRVEVALSRQALRDPLTGLANRALFRDRVEHALARLARESPAAAPHVRESARQVAVLYLDLDGFKGVNDSFGHHAGDEVLRAVASRLLNATRGCDTAARLGGDEFAVLLENVSRPGDAEVVAERIIGALRAPVALASCGAPPARVGVSVGIAFAEPTGDADALLRHADAAMYHAKAEGKGCYAIFDPALVDAAVDRQALRRDLARAVAGLAAADADLDAGESGGRRSTEFALVYQPAVALDTGAVVGAEALVRWRHPARGVVGPCEFIPLAEASGLIVELGRWVLEEACRTAAAWPAAPGGAPMGIAVNVSGRQFDDSALADHVAGALAASGLAAECLTLEVTESVLMRHTDAALATLRRLKTLGIRVAIDDFGTGYSSLAYLQQFPVDVLKIDKRFVDGVHEGGSGEAIVRTVVALGDALGLRIVAEGVEHAAQAAALRGMGCAEAQGYLFARPMDAEALAASLEPAPDAARLAGVVASTTV
jgi:diguanylate cyclase (GGDEF)-like protein